MDGLSYLQFSSGSTRFPLGVAVTQRALMANQLAMSRDGVHVGPTDRMVSWLPLYHDMGLVGLLMGPVSCPELAGPPAHRRLRAPAATVARHHHPQPRHHLLQPHLRL
ncbi:MAG: AMP-binding protein [Caulobacteraceae bacterium]